MLAPHNRHLLLDMIRPPAGYRFDSGIGTTFTLDLFTLLAVPLSLVIYDRDSLDDALRDPITLLDSLRQTADRLAIFCQAGYIHAPAHSSHLFHHLEKMVVQVQAPFGGVFHPKVWILRYTSENSLPIYRLLNLSRNLTTDRSWDIALRLDGQSNESENLNKPLVDFISALPSIATQSEPVHIQSLIDEMAKAVSNVVFEPPVGFKKHFSFRPIGLAGYRGYPLSNDFDRVMVVSPFLTNNFINNISSQGNNHVLVSRQDSLDSLPADSLERFENIYILDQMAEPDSDDSESELLPSDEQLSGLHAKLIIGEKGNQATWLVGSANATDAAFNSNVEFTVLLDGERQAIGIETVLGNEGKGEVFRDLLSKYSPPESTDEKDAHEHQAEKIANDVRCWLVRSRLSILVKPVTESTFDLIIESNQSDKSPAGKYEISCFPVTLGRDYSQEISAVSTKLNCRFANVSFSALTSFMVFNVAAYHGKGKFSIAFILNLPISGLPSNRADVLLAEIIANPRQFLRYLRLLLADEGWQLAPNEIMMANNGASWQFSASSTTWDEDMPLLEDLVRALSRSPEQKIERISNLIAQLKLTPQGQALIPSEFDSLWNILQQARRELG